MCAALTLDRQAHRGTCHPLHPAHQTRGCSLWQSENREKGQSFKKMNIGFSCSATICQQTQRWKEKSQTPRTHKRPQNVGERETVKMRKEREFKSTILFYYVNVITNFQSRSLPFKAARERRNERTGWRRGFISKQKHHLLPSQRRERDGE